MGIGMRAKVVLPVIAAILILGSSGIDQQSYGQEVEPSLSPIADQNPPLFRDDDCSLTYSFTGDPLEPTPDTNPVHGGTCTKGPLNTIDADGNLIPSVEYKSNVCPTEVDSQILPCDGVHLMIPNFIDNLLVKKVRIQVLYDPSGSTPSVKHPGGVKEDLIPGPAVNPEICFRDAPPTNTISGYFFEDWTCNKNPINEVIWFEITDAAVTEIIVDTVSFGMPVGGELIPVDSTSLLVAGAQANALWLIPVLVSAIGIGIVIARKF